LATATLKLDLVDVRGNGISDDVRVELASMENSQRYRNTVFVKRTVEVAGVSAGAFSRYQVTVWPSDYRVSQFFVVLRDGQTTTRDPLVFPVDPGKVTGIRAKQYAELDARLRNVLEASMLDTNSGLQGSALYEALDAPRKACLLNIFTKAASTRLLDGSSCFDHVGGLIKLRGDRFFARTKAALREEVQNAKDLFGEVSGALHHSPIEGYTDAKSFKTKDKYGNLQLTFFRRGTTGDDYLVDADIDEASGIKHGFEVFRNWVADHTTDPFEIRDVLIRHQLLDPGYEFQFAEAAAASA
jgi:hypothetical protein